MAPRRGIVAATLNLRMTSPPFAVTARVRGGGEPRGAQAGASGSQMS